MLAWIEAILGEKLPAGSFDEVLRDGTVLCKLIQKLLPGSVPKINTSGGQFKFMENINHFQTACRKYGVPDVDVFQTVDLYERRNIPAVTQCIMALGRTCYLHPEFKGPFLGPKVSGTLREALRSRVGKSDKPPPMQLVAHDLARTFKLERKEKRVLISSQIGFKCWLTNGAAS